MPLIMLLGKLVTKFMARGIPVHKNKSSVNVGNDNLRHKFLESSDNVSGYRIMNPDPLKGERQHLCKFMCL